ncbi:PilZ domain-containing protein [Candidatus Omnitrophota bacterium]
MKDNRPHKEENAERRKYIRLNVVFPVEFQFLDPETGGSISDIKQGFTRDVGKGGICLEVNNIEEGFEEILRLKKARLDLRLHIPLGKREVKAVASIAWHEKIKAGYPNKYLVGLSFREIDPKEGNRVYLHAKRISLTPKVVSIFILSLIVGLAYFYTSGLKLRIENKKLVTKFVEISAVRSKFQKDIIDFDRERKEIEKSLLENQEKIKQYKDRVKDAKKISLELRKKDKLLEDFEKDSLEIKERLKEALSEKHKSFNKVTLLSKEAEYLKKRITRLSKDSVSAEDSLKELLSSFEEVEEKGMSSLYRWIKNHQNAISGLVVSYEGDKDLDDWAFTYDQSLAAQSFTLKGDKDNAQRILDFYKEKAEKVYGGFVNAYDAYTGLIVEYDVHAGPNIWLGLAVLQYTDKFKDERYLSLAEDIGKWLIKLQREDIEFGIRGGPNFTWFSTEHNLDAYAFFGMLHKITEEKIYKEAQERVLGWIKKRGFNRREGRLNRGKGDATIATDTFAWAIAAIGPRLLKERDMDPDQIMDFAETNCLVNTYYKRPDGERLSIVGFDFGKYKHLARGGVISTEWTAQMVVSLRIMAGYHREEKNFIKANYYKKKADFYLSELAKMVIVSPSKIGQGEGCLPYASQDDVDTGHGWRVARGATTGSTAGTAYTIFARHNYNPLAFE